MCGRYVLADDPFVLESEFGAEFVEQSRYVHPNFNVAPTTSVPIITAQQDTDGSGFRRIIQMARWGIIPRWKSGKATILVNARGESVSEKSTFKKAFATSRCLIPASGYYEWKRPEKDPYYIRNAHGTPLAMAGLLMDSEIEGTSVVTCAIITCAAAPNIEFIHDRMPATIKRGDWREWLDPDVSASHALQLMHGEVDLIAGLASRRVNSTRNNDPSLLGPDRQPDVLM